jgi:hypothetical protein
MTSRTLIPLAAVAATLLFAVPASASEVGVALGSNATPNTITQFAVDAPGQALTPPATITGLDTGEVAQSVDFRPSTGELFLLAVNPSTDTGHLYRLDPATGAATKAGGGVAIPGLDFDAIDIDFNPVTDKIRLSGARFVPQPTSITRVLDPENLPGGSSAAPFYAPGDVNAGVGVFLAGGAYTENHAGASQTTYFGMSGSRLVRMGSPDGSPDSADTGKLTTIGDVPHDSISFFPEALDVSGTTGIAYATVNKKVVNGNTTTNLANLVKLNLATAQATPVGPVVGGFITDMAIALPAPGVPAGTPPAAGPAGPAGQPPAALDAAPVLSGVSFVPRTFAPLGTPRAVRRTRLVKRGSVLRYSLSEAASVEILVSRALPGRRVSGKCRKPAKSNAKRTRCVRLVKRGVLRVQAKAGRNATRFSGRLGRRPLASGSYRAALTAIDGTGKRSAKRTVSFRVLRG